MTGPKVRWTRKLCHFNHTRHKVRPRCHQPLRVHATVADKAQESPGIQCGTQGIGHQPCVRAKTGFVQQHLDVPAPQRGGRNLRPAARRPFRPFGRQYQFAILHHIGDSAGTEGDEPFQRWSTWTQRRRSGHELRLESCLGVIKQHQHQPGTVSKTAEHGSLANPRTFRETVHGQGWRTALVDELTRSRQQPLPVTRGIAALGGRLRSHSRPQWDGPHSPHPNAGNISGPRSV